MRKSDKFEFAPTEPPQEAVVSTEELMDQLRLERLWRDAYALQKGLGITGMKESKVDGKGDS